MTNKPTSEAGKQAEWELAFDERFDHFNELYIGSDQPGVINHPDIGKQICSVDCEKNSDLNDVKEFIRTLLAKERQRMVEEIQREADIVQEVKLESGDNIFYIKSADTGCDLPAKTLKKYEIEKCVSHGQFSIFSLRVK